jgi:hypothetical protein
MNLEELSKSQLILLMILVNVVVSVATGVLTVSLLDQAPPVVAKTVNQIVDHTIETVAAAAPVIAAPTPAAPAPSTQDLVTGALAATATRTVDIYTESTGTSTPAVAVGTYLSGSRAVATAALAVLPKEALIVFADGTSQAASLAHSGGGVAIYGFGDKATLPAGSSPALVPATSLKLGETVLALAPDGSAETGIVSQVTGETVHTTLADTSAGPTAVDLSGNIIGVLAGGTPGDLISAAQIFTLLTATSSVATSTASHS